MRKLKITSRAAVKREDARYPEIFDYGFWEDGGYEGLPAALVARAECLSYLGALIKNGYTAPSDIVDDWLTRLARLLPKAARRPLTDAELSPIIERREAE